MSDSIDEAPVCPTCKQPLQPQVVGEEPARFDGPHGTAQIEQQVGWQCENANCPESGSDLAPAAPTH